MTNTYERTILLQAADRLARRYSARSSVAEKLSDWVEATDLGFAWEPESDHRQRRGVSVAVWQELRARLAAHVGRLGRGRPDALARTAGALAGHVGLSEDETVIFELAVRAARSGPLKSLCDELTDDARLSIEDAMVHLTGLPAACVRKALAPSARLMTTGLLARERPPFLGLGVVPSDRLLAALEPPSRGLQDTLERLFVVPAPAEVAWEDFDYLGAARGFALRLLEGALASGARGVNILFHGAPGTGKTELCKVLAERLGARLHAVGETDDDGDEPSRGERLQQLRLGQRLLAEQGRSLILFDEMEDLFPPPMALFGAPMRGGSKVHMHRLLESNPVPTLWTTNDISACDPALLRRITFTLELRTPSAPIRARVWQRLGRKRGMPIGRALAQDLARSFEDAPALADSALRAARIARGGPEEVRLAVAALAHAVRGGHSPVPAGNTGPAFDPALARADHDLGRLADRLQAMGPTAAASLCLNGAPGTGKSAFARHLADRLGMPVLEKRASDLLDRYVGGSERNIADAFAEARDSAAFLIFDEADSLLGARAGAVQRWEVTQVNEMLTWMEAHPLPFACTTNLPDRLDPAALRRFSLRVTFLPLDAAQRLQAFRRFFGVDAPPGGLAPLDLLTPGDFAVVARRAGLLGITEPAALLSELAREQAAKPGAGRPIGFRAA